MPELLVDSVNHWYGDKEILSSVYLNCKIGEVVGLLGRNGCGKSTLLKIIFGSIAPKFKYLNIDSRIYSKGYLSKKLSYLPQDQFIPEQISLSAAIDIFCKTNRKALIKIKLIADNLNAKFYDLSGGQARYLECLLMIYSDHQYVLLDEPFSQLAPVMIEDLKAHINHVKTHKGFIITDHYYDSILDVSDRIVLLHNRCNYSINRPEDLVLHGYLPEFNA